MSQLKKELGVFDVFSIASGAMISSGLFVLPGLAFARVGPAVFLCYGFASLLMLPTLFSQAELATAMPKSGGSYFFIERSLGALPGTLAGLSNWFSIALKAAFALYGLGALAALAVGSDSEWMMKIVAALGCALFMGMNMVSVKHTGRFQTLMVGGLLALIAAYIIWGFLDVKETHFIPFLNKGIGYWEILATTGMVFISYGGLTKVVDVAGEVKNPEKNLVRGMLAAYIVVSVLYVLAVLVTVGLVDPKSLAESLAPLAEGASVRLGRLGAILLGIAAFLAFVTTANAGILSASRSPMAMSRDGLLPEALAHTSTRFKTPWVAILITGGFMISVILALSLERLVKTASTMMLITFILTNLAAIIMRHSGLQAYRPTFRAPFHPWLQVIAIIIYWSLIVKMGAIPLIIAGGFILFSGLWYAGYVHRRIDRESAIVFLVKRIMSRHLKRTRLEDELRQISLERDTEELDRFDHLIHECEILDLKDSLSARDFFHRVAEVLARRLHQDPDRIFNLFLEREKESSTIVQPGLAFPHIVLDGSGLFDVMIVRCKPGIIFSELSAPVTKVFILVGSQDERNYHLRALMSIARLVQDPEFERRWDAAASSEQIRDVVLLTRRERDHSAPLTKKIAS